ncbi:MAG TPA: metallophosphoesterase family protein [Caulobacteraceae bacterium]
MLRELRGKAFGRRRAGADPTSGELVYAIGDVHGRYDLLKQLISMILDDWKVQGADRRPLVIFCGDYVDRGPESAAVLEALIWLQQRTDIQACFLKGNHEAGMMRFLDNPPDCAGWLRFGGVETLKSYGVVAPSPEDPSSCFRARDLLLQRMPSSHLRFLERLELMLVVGDYAFVHAGVQPGVDLRGQREEDLLWIRQEFLTDEGPFEKIIVHGHSWTDDKPQVLPHRIGIDTGAYATGVLTAVRLDGADVGLLQARAGGWTEADGALQTVSAG